MRKRDTNIRNTAAGFDPIHVNNIADLPHLSGLCFEHQSGTCVIYCNRLGAIVTPSTYQ
jgi:hypothetical protein